MPGNQLPTAKKNPFNRLINSTKIICAAAVKKGAKLREKLSGSEPVKEFFTVKDYANWITTRIAQVTAACDATEDAIRNTQYKIELAGLLNQQKDPMAAYEAPKTKLVKYAENFKRLAKDTDVKGITLIWRALAMDNTEPAESLLQRTVEILSRSRRRNSGKLFNAITNLAHICEMRGDLEAALIYHQQALEVREKALGPEHPDLAGALNNMATLCEVRGHVDAAYEYIKRAVQIYQSSLGPNGPKVAAALSNLADICQKKNRHEKAEQTYQQGLAIALKSGGVDSPLYVQIKSNLEGHKARV